MRLPKFKLNLGFKIASGYAVVIFLAVASTILGVYYLSVLKAKEDRFNKVLLPVNYYLSDLNNIKNESHQLVKLGIYTGENYSDKFNTIQSGKFSKIKNGLMNLTNDYPEDSTLSDLLSLTIEYDEYFSNQLKYITRAEEVQRVANKDSAIYVLNSEYKQSVNSSFNTISTQLDNLKNKTSKEYDELLEVKGSALNKIILTLILGALFVALLSVVFSFITIRELVTRIVALKDAVLALGKGEIQKIDKDKKTDEITSMTVALNKLVDGIASKASFADEIGKGKYDIDFKALSEDDVLGKSLITMRNNLQKNAYESDQRNRTTVGLAKMAEILRQTQLDTEELLDNVLSFVVKYVNANQGALYLVDKNDANQDILKMKACYAFDRKKYIDYEVEQGVGLIGQCYLERKEIFMSDVPNEYIKITSGLGKSNPKCVFIIPLMVNDEIYGILELASFVVWNEFEKDMLKQIAQSIASSLFSIQINERTQKLLSDSREQMEMLHSQEEEMRQNMEELAATQEEMERKEKEMHKLLQEISEREAKNVKIAQQKDQDIKNYILQIAALEKTISELKAQIDSK